MRLRNWTRLSWWQKTRLAALAISGFACGCVFLMIVVLAGLSRTSSLGSLSWFAFSAFPLLVVVLIATLARLQELINLRSSGSRSSGVHATRFVSGDAE